MLFNYKYYIINHESLDIPISKWLTGIGMGICFLSLVLIPKTLLLFHGSAIELLLVVLSLSSVVILFDPRSAPASLHISNLLELVRVQSRLRVTDRACIFVAWKCGIRRVHRLG
jgi:hypothetical protein